MASPQLQNVISMLRSASQNAGALDVSTMRAAIEVGGKFFGPEPGTATEPVSADGVPGEWIRAEGASEAVTIYYLHGGGHAIGSIESHRGLISRLSRASGARAFAIDYRLAPENPYPAGLEDSVKAYRWLLAQGVDPSSIVIGGDSAGGNLTMTTLLALKDAGDPLPGAAVLLSPWTDLTSSGESMKTRADLDPMIPVDPAHEAATTYAGNTPLDDPLISPLFGDLAGLPPMLIQVGDYEVLLDDSTRLAENAKAAGVDVTLEVWDEMIHVWQFFAPLVPEANDAIERIGQYIRSKVPAGVAA